MQHPPPQQGQSSNIYLKQPAHAYTYICILLRREACQNLVMCILLHLPEMCSESMTGG